MQYNSKDCVLYHGDCVEVIKQLPDNSIHLTISSFPFANLYTYSDDERDFSNVKDLEEYFSQLDFLIPELKRITKPGRLICLHLKQIPTFKGRDGEIGLIDFRGMMIKAFQSHGWTFHNEICIWTDPEIEATRTKANSILYKTYRTQAEQTRVGMADWLIVMRKWTDEVCEHVLHEHTDESFKKWTEIASPCWFDIDRTNVLNKMIVKDDKDEKHMTPLQLDLIERLIDWYTNKGEIVFDPFNGVGSVTYQAVKAGRKAIGIELKPSFFNQSIKTMQLLEKEKNQISLEQLLGETNE